MVTKNMNKNYIEADKFFIVNDNDNDLFPIRIELPKPPKLEKIDGYGLEPKEQKWRPPKTLVKLQHLSTKYGGNPKLIWEVLTAQQSKYRDEIKWIKKQWWHRFYGYWFFCNGKPTYLDGWHYFYLSFFNLDVGLPEYRDRDRRVYLFARYCFTATKDIFGNEYNRRICYGFNYPKHRRDGATFKAISIILEDATGHSVNSLYGIQSYGEDNAKKHYQKKLVPAFQKLPFFFKPNWAGSINPQKRLNFIDSATNESGGGKKYIPDKQLGNEINYAETADRSEYDGQKYKMIELTEEGKTKLEDIYERWQRYKPVLSQGGGSVIDGFSIHDTTVEELTNEGGQHFLDLCSESHIEKVNKTTGQTTSGLYNLFIPAYDGLEGFVGEFGESIIETPTPQQARFIKQKIGAKEHLQSQRDELLRQNTATSLSQYRGLCKLFPFNFAECFLGTSGDLGFNMQHIDMAIERMNRLQDEQPFTVMWQIGGERFTAKQMIAKNMLYTPFDGRVVFVPDTEGRFMISSRGRINGDNQKFFSDGSWCPTNGKRFTASADPTQFLDIKDLQAKMEKSTNSDRKSWASGAAFENRDEAIDPPTKDIKDWITHNFVMVYKARPDDNDEHAEEMLMMCVYLGAYMYPENNLDSIYKHFIKRGYAGYLKYDFDETGKLKTKPGFTTLGHSYGSKQKMFDAMMTFVEYHFHRLQSMMLANDCKNISAMKELTKYDVFASCGGCLLGTQSRYGEFTEEDGGVELSELFTEFNY